MKKGQLVKVYDGDLVGFTTARLEEKFESIEEGVLERWSMMTIEGYKLVRFVRNESIALKDGCGYIIKEENAENDIIKRSFYCKDAGESHYDISDEFYINTFEDEKYIDICRKDNPEIEGLTIDTCDIIKIAKIIQQENKEKEESEKIE